MSCCVYHSIEVGCSGERGALLAHPGRRAPLSTTRMKGPHGSGSRETQEQSREAAETMDESL